ncbi:MAG: alpha/beta fold hydrolase [Bacilli bacterium]
MKKVLKIILLSVASLIGVSSLFVGGVAINHQVKLDKEIKLLKEEGYYNKVSVGSYSLNVSIFGKEDGKHTFVGLAGLGSGDFSCTMRKATAGIEKDNKVVFIDRAGYGFSDDTSKKMTLDSVVEDYRKALQNASIPAPYILMAHSLGGAYATYWCSKYKEEIEGIVFIDGSQLSENAFEDSPDSKVTISDRFLQGLAKCGFSRLALRNYFYHLPKIFSEEDQAKADTLALLTLDSIAPVSESYSIQSIAKMAFDKIIKNDVPKTYICASWGLQTKEDIIEYNMWINEQIDINHLNMPKRNTSYSDEDVIPILNNYKKAREEELMPYLEKMGNCELVLLPGDHMIYEHKPEQCSNLLLDFVTKIEK